MADIFEKKGKPIFYEDSRLGYYIYWWMNEYKNQKYPKVGIAEILKTRAGKLTVYTGKMHTKEGGTFYVNRRIYLNIPEIPKICEALIEMYNNLKSLWEQEMGQKLTQTALSTTSEIQDSQRVEELSEIEKFAKELSDFGIKKS